MSMYIRQDGIAVQSEWGYRSSLRIIEATISHRDFIPEVPVEEKKWFHQFQNAYQILRSGSAGQGLFEKM